MQGVRGFAGDGWPVAGGRQVSQRVKLAGMPRSLLHCLLTCTLSLCLPLSSCWPTTSAARRPQQRSMRWWRRRVWAGVTRCACSASPPLRHVQVRASRAARLGLSIYQTRAFLQQAWPLHSYLCNAHVWLMSSPCPPNAARTWPPLAADMVLASDLELGPEAHAFWQKLLSSWGEGEE